MQERLFLFKEKVLALRVASQENVKNKKFNVDFACIPSQNITKGRVLNIDLVFT